MKPTSPVAILVFLVASFLGSVRAQTHDKKNEIPIERCDRLPVVIVERCSGTNNKVSWTEIEIRREAVLCQAQQRIAINEAR
jgi:hypothetical protein